jgi:hypothetical protein
MGAGVGDNATMRWRRVAILAALVCLAGCGRSKQEAADSNQPNPQVRMPAHFPLPPGASIQQTHLSGVTRGYKLFIAGGAEAARFWRRELPSHGWHLGHTTVAPTVAIQNFAGHGFGGGKHTSYYLRTNHPHVAVVVFTPDR